MSDNFYNEEFLSATLKEVRAALDDLSAWSIHNGDTALDEIVDLKKQLEGVEQEIMGEQFNKLLAEEENYNDNGSVMDQYPEEFI